MLRSLKRRLFASKKPILLVSFADMEAVNEFSESVFALSEHVELYVTTPNISVDCSEHFQLHGQVADTADWRDSVAFASRCIASDLERRPFVLRLPLHTGSVANLTATRIAIGSLADPVGFSKIGQAFADDPSLSMIGPDLLYQPLFPLVRNNLFKIAEIEKVAETPLLASDAGTFQSQAFALSGRALSQMRPVLERYEPLLANERSVIPYGQPGSIGAAMDLLWCALSIRPGCKLGLIRKRLDDDEVVLRIGAPKQFVVECGRGGDFSSTLKRQSRASPDFDLLTREHDFKPTQYRQKNSELIPETYSELEHYVHFGDEAEIYCTDELNISEYRLFSGSDIASFDNALCHWIVRGRPNVKVPINNWLDFAKARDYFDADWMAEKYPELGNATQVEDTFQRFPELWGRATSPNFKPDAIPILSKSSIPGESVGLSEFLKHHHSAEKRAYEQLRACLQEQDQETAQDYLDNIEKRYGDTHAIDGVRAYLAISNHDWVTAEKALNSLWLKHIRGHKPLRHMPSMLGDYDTTNVHSFETVRKKRPNSRLPKVCVYTAIFGDSDVLLPNLTPPKNIEFICFSDTPREALGWDVRVVKPRFESANRSAKYYKILPHKVLSEFEYSLFVDGNTLLAGDIERLVSEYLDDVPFAMWPHPERCDVYREAVAILQSGRHRPKEILQQIRFYAERGMPPRTGLAEGSFIWRNHLDANTIEFMEAWWDEILSHSSRDQLSLGYLFWQRQQKPKMLPAELGTSRRNAFFLKVPHRSAPKRSSTPNKKAPITFLFHPDRKESGSTVMRGEQLSRIVSETMQDREVIYSQGLEWRSRILFLTKGFLEKTSAADLQRLRAQGNFLIGDFVDAKPDKNKASCVDVLVAASISGYEYLSRNYLRTPIYHLTHHIDPRIAQGNDAIGFSAGYVGEEVNAVWSPKIKDFVTLIQVDTKQRQDNWLQKIRSSNFHYAVRNSREIDGFKPFLKGFTAARCEAPILTQKTIGDAIYYLGEDYPFLLPADPTEEEIVNILDLAKVSYNKPIWKDAKDRMRQIAERTTNEVVVDEFKQILRD